MTYKLIINARMFMLATILFVASTHAHGQQAAAKQGLSTAAAGSAAPVVGSGTAGQITKWTGFSGTIPAIGDSAITEDKFGKIGIGTTSPTSTLTVRGTIETTLGGYKFPDGTIQITAFDPNQVVRSLNGLRGDLTLAAGQNITLTASGGNTLTIAAPNALTSVFHNATLAGSGTSASPLSISDAGVGTIQLADNAVVAAKIAPGQVVRGLNGLTDNIQLSAGSGITLTPVGNSLTIAATAADPDQNAFQREVKFLIPDGEISPTKTISVPAGKRLVIEYVTISGVSDADLNSIGISTTVAGVSAIHTIRTLPGFESFQGGVDRLVRIYSDTDVGLFVGKSVGGLVDISITISGHLVDLP